MGLVVYAVGLAPRQDPGCTHRSGILLFSAKNPFFNGNDSLLMTYSLVFEVAFAWYDAHVC